MSPTPAVTGASPFNSWLARNVNKARSGLWNLIGNAVDSVQANVATPLVQERDQVLGVVSQTVKIGKSALTGAAGIASHWMFILIIIGLVAAAYLFGPLVRRLSKG